MASGRPKVAESPLELLTSPPNIEQSILSKIWFPTVGAVTGFTGVCIANYVNHQPKLSGIENFRLLLCNLLILLIFRNTETYIRNSPLCSRCNMG